MMKTITIKTIHDELYYDLIWFLEDIKTSFGGGVVQATLRKRHKLSKFLSDYQKQKLDSIEKHLDKK